MRGSGTPPLVEQRMPTGAGRRAALGQFARYVATGGVAFLVDVGVFHLLSGAAVGIVLAGVVSFTVASVVNYVLSARFAFRHDRLSAAQGLRFMLVATVGLGLGILLTAAIHHYVGVQPTVARVAALGIMLFWNFAAHRLLVFNRV